MIRAAVTTIAAVLVTAGVAVAVTPPAVAETRPTVTVTHGINGDGKRVVCVVASTGGVDCDFDRPTRLQPR